MTSPSLDNILQQMYDEMREQLQSYVWQVRTPETLSRIKSDLRMILRKYIQQGYFEPDLMYTTDIFIETDPHGDTIITLGNKDRYTPPKKYYSIPLLRKDINLTFQGLTNNQV